MGLEAGDEAAADAALTARRAADAARLLPPVVVARQGRPETYHVPTAPLAGAEVAFEDGAHRELTPDQANALSLPRDLPVGDHRLVAVDPSGREAAATVIVAPAACPLPSSRRWGWMAQVYGARSADSWGIGEFADLRALTTWTAGLGGDFVVVNPLHATNPVLPQEPSPYYPSSRRYVNPLYLRVDDVPEISALDRSSRERVADLASATRARNREDRIDRDAVFEAKMEALALVHAAPRPPERAAAYARFRAREGEALVGFATFCAIAERHGTPFQRWPAALRSPDAPGVAHAREELGDRVDFHMWLQWLADEQLASVQAAGQEAGMGLGLISDLAVGVDPGGADAWALQEELAGEVTVGAPPDPFNQAGQDWGMPPLRPDRLSATGYAPLRQLLAPQMRHAGGVRIDHVLGLFRLYWIPEGAPPHAGTYVRYPGDELLGVLALEAQRAGAVVVGEDLGTVERGVRDRLAENAVLGSRVLYFEHSEEGEGFRAPEYYPERVLSSVTTHDLPTATGWWAGQGVATQRAHGLLDPDEAEVEHARLASDHAALADLLRRDGLLARNGEPTLEDLVLATHALLARTPSLLVAGMLHDAVGDRRQPNLPGTSTEDATPNAPTAAADGVYPNWRLPLAEPADAADPADATSAPAQPVLLEELMARPRAMRLAAALSRGDRHGVARGRPQS